MSAGAAGIDVSSAGEAAAAIAVWARTNTDEVCQAVIETLNRLEGRSLAPRVLLEIAEVLRPPGDDVIAGYRAGYTDRALPLGDDEARRFGSAMALLDAFESLYCQTFERILAGAEGGARETDLLARAIQRSMACLVVQMIEHYRARQAAGLALWKKLQQRMQAAIREQLDAVEVPDRLSLRGRATPHETYGSAMLLSIAQAGAMTYRSLEATLNLVALFSCLVELVMLDTDEGAGRGAHSGMAGIGIRRTGRIRVVVAGGVTHLVNTTRIDQTLNRHIQELQEGRSPEELGLAAVARADLAGLLPRLRRIWCGGGDIRATPRQPVHGQSAFAIGFREICEFASKGPIDMPKEFRLYSGEQQVFVRAMVALPGDPPANPVESWQTLDHSAAGMRAVRPRPGARLRRGQLLAVDLHGMQHGVGLALAEVRWLEQLTDSDAGGIAAGIRFLSSHTQVAVVRGRGVLRGEYQSVAPALVLDQPRPQLVLPMGWFAPARKLDLWHREQVTALKLTDLRARGTDYEIAGYEPAPAPPGLKKSN